VSAVLPGCHDFLLTLFFFIGFDAVPIESRDQRIVKSGGDQEMTDAGPDSGPRTSMRGRGGFTGASRGGRSSISAQHGQPRSLTTLVVENIPPEFCNLDKVNEFFKKFGTITNIQVERQFWRATVQYATPYEAKAAHSSPDPVFGNRFVKIFYMSLEAANAASGAATGMDTDKPAEPPKPTLTPEEQAEREAKLKEIREAEEKVKKEQLHAKIQLAKLQAKEQLAAKAAEGGAKQAMWQEESEKARLDRDLEMIASGEPADLKNLLQSKVAELQAEVRRISRYCDCSYGANYCLFLAGASTGCFSSSRNPSRGWPWLLWHATTKRSTTGFVPGTGTWGCCQHFGIHAARFAAAAVVGFEFFCQRPDKSSITFRGEDKKLT
jgi:hypothetical protein